MRENKLQHIHNDHAHPRVDPNLLVFRSQAARKNFAGVTNKGSSSFTNNRIVQGTHSDGDRFDYALFQQTQGGSHQMTGQRRSTITGSDSV